MRGERRLPPCRAIRCDGSSPRARGTREFDCCSSSQYRFIPACAGNASKGLRSVGSAAVHPRVRGERCVREATRMRMSGSSPRARGTLHRSPRLRSDYRFIPACAGNASFSFSEISEISVHPRVRGERHKIGSHQPHEHGSSPRARGTLRHRNSEDRAGRFIPACAGNARWAATTRRSLSVHPRVRGERAPSRTNASYRDGSSPRARGTQRRGRRR